MVFILKKWNSMMTCQLKYFHKQTQPWFWMCVMQPCVVGKELYKKLYPGIWYESVLQHHAPNEAFIKHNF